MTKLLHLFIKEPLDSPKARMKIGRLSGFFGLICNLILFVGKLCIGILSRSVSITADAMNNLSDASSSIVTLIGFKLAEKPADADHPYGHARYEYLSGLAVAAIIIVIGFELAKSSIEKILSPTAVLVTVPLIVVLALSILVKLTMYFINKYLGRQIHSTTLLATAADSRNDVIATSAVLAAAIIEKFTDLPVDGYIGLAVAIFILYSGASLARQTISPLLGEAADPALQQMILDIVRENPRVLGYHDLMVHDYGPGQRFASVHVEMDRNEDPMLCHDIIDDLERECLTKHNVHLVVHYDPVVTGDAALDQIRQCVSRILSTFDSRLSIHDFRMVQGNGHTNLIFDIAIPDDLLPQKKAIKRYLDTQLCDLDDTTYYTVITFDPTAFNQK